MKKTKGQFVRYDDTKRKAIAAFLKTNTNEAAKKKFGCSAHFCSHLRQEFKIVLPKKTSPVVRKNPKPAGKKKPSGKKKSGGAVDSSVL